MQVQESVLLMPPQPLTPDDVSGLIAVIIDELDLMVGEPSVRTAADEAGTAVRFTVTMDVTAPDEYQARARAAAALRDAFKAAGIVLSADSPAGGALLLTA